MNNFWVFMSLSIQLMISTDYTYKNYSTTVFNDATEYMWKKRYERFDLNWIILVATTCFAPHQGGSSGGLLQYKFKHYKSLNKIVKSKQISIDIINRMRKHQTEKSLWWQHTPKTQKHTEKSDSKNITVMYSDRQVTKTTLSLNKVRNTRK